MTDVPGDELSSEDAELLRDVAGTFGTEPVPERLCEGLLTWADVDHELAELLDAPAEELAGTRGGAAASATELTFEVGHVGTVVELRTEGDRVTGQVLPAGATDARLERPDGNQ
jgi:hypothetical protein